MMNFHEMSCNVRGKDKHCLEFRGRRGRNL